jgi:hypothetical protein
LVTALRGSQAVFLAYLLLGGDVLGHAREKGAESDRLTFPTFGFSVDPPGAPYVQAPETTSWQAIRWVGSNRDEKERGPTIYILIQPVRGRELPEFAKTVAKIFRGRISESRTLLGGERTVELRPEVAPASDAPTPLALGWLAQHHNNFYALLLLTRVQQDIDQQAAQRIAESWRWRAVDTPDKHLAVGEQTVEIFGELTFRPATLMRPDTQFAEDPAKKVGFLIHNFASDRNAYSLYFERVPTPDRPAMKELAERWTKNLEMHVGNNDAITWAPVKGKLGAVISSPVRREVRATDGRAETGQVRIVLVPVGDDTTVKVTIYSPVLDKEQNERTEELTARLLATLKRKAH